MGPHITGPARIPRSRACSRACVEVRLQRVAMRAGVPEHLHHFDLARRCGRGWAGPPDRSSRPVSTCHRAAGAVGQVRDLLQGGGAHRGIVTAVGSDRVAAEPAAAAGLASVSVASATGALAVSAACPAWAGGCWAAAPAVAPCVFAGPAAWCPQAPTLTASRARVSAMVRFIKKAPGATGPVKSGSLGAAFQRTRRWSSWSRCGRGVAARRASDEGRTL